MTLAAPLQPLTETTLVDPGDLEQELVGIAEAKLAYDRNEFHLGVAAVATYVRTGDGNPVALGIVVPHARFDEKLDDLREELLAVRPELERFVATP